MSNALTPAPSAQQLRALFFALPAASRELSADRDLRNARVNVSGQWLILGQLGAVETDALLAATRSRIPVDMFSSSHREEIL